MNKKLLYILICTLTLFSQSAKQQNKDYNSLFKKLQFAVINNRI